MNYTDLLKRAYRIVIRHKFLWLFGLLGGASFGFGNGGVSGYRPDSKDTQAISKIGSFISQHIFLIIVIALVILLIFIAFFILSIISKGALVGCVKKINDKEKTGIRDGFKMGWHNFWRVLGINIFLFLIIFIPLLVFIFCLIFIFIIPVIGWIIGILLILLLIPLIIIASFILGVLANMAYCYCVIDGLSIRRSLTAAWNLFKSKWKKLLIVFLLLLLIGIVVGIAIFIVLLILGIPLFLIGLAVYSAVGITVTIIYIILASLITLIISAILSGALGAYNSTVWILTYLNLAKNTPIEE
jgi:hypothetical protein